MKFTYCPDCGSLLTHRDLGDEVGVPWCDRCDKPWFPVFPVAVIALVYNDAGEVLLLRQNYISSEFCNLVSGYILPGEDAEYRHHAHRGPPPASSVIRSGFRLLV